MKQMWLLTRFNTEEVPLLSLVVFALVMFVTPVIVIILDLLFFADSISREAAIKILDSGIAVLIPQVALLGISPVIGGLSMILCLFTIQRKMPAMSWLLKIFISQALSIWVAIAALLHNPQGEYCSNRKGGLSITRIYAEEICFPSIDLAILQFVWAFVFVFFLLAVKRIFQSILRSNGGNP